MKLIEIDAVFQADIGYQIQAFCMCKLDLNVSELICGDKFFVTLLEMQDVIDYTLTYVAKKVQLLSQLELQISSLSEC